MLNQLDEMLTLHILQGKLAGQNHSDDVVDQMPDIKNVCFKVHKSFVDDIDRVCNLLGITRRRFLIEACKYAIDRFESLADEHGLWDVTGDDK
jgi:hypothetical protein